MTGFWIRTGSLLAVVCILLTYNTVLASREKEEEIAQMSARIGALEEYIKASQKAEAAVQAMEAAETETEAAGAYIDGEWEGEAQGFGGLVSVKITVENGMISRAEIVSAEKEDKTYLSMAEAMLPAIVEAQSADVDTISGATFSSEGIKNAAAQALKKAEK